MREAEHNRRLAAAEQLLFDPGKGGDIRVVVAYPNHYRVAMSNLGFQTIYRLFAEQPRLSVERAYLPEYENPLSGIRTFESDSLLAKADVIAISVSFETDYQYVLPFLEASGRNLDYCWETRKESEKPKNQRFGPLVLGGGVALTLNPEPLANFFDAIIIGEGEEVVSELVSHYLEARDGGLSREELLLKLAGTEGVYVPSLYQVSYDPKGPIRQFIPLPGVSRRVRRRYVRDINRYPTHTTVQTPHTEFSSMFLTETGRGCEQGCRFCAAGYVYRPIRRRSKEVIEESLRNGLNRCSGVGFVGAAVSGHPAITELSRTPAADRKRVSLSSLMSQKVSTELACSLAENGLKSVALAPEAGSEALRFRIGKRVTNEQIQRAITTLAEAGISGFRLYFMIGLPTEDLTDIEQIAYLSAQLRTALFSRAGPKPGEARAAPRIVLSVNPFVPKAWTPFQRHGFMEIQQLKERLAVIRQGLGGIPNVEMKTESPRESYFQALLSRGDRRVGDLLLTMHQQQRDWRWIVKHGSSTLLESVPEPDYYVYRNLDREETLPWEIIDSGVSRELLEREYEKTINHVEEN